MIDGSENLDDRFRTLWDILNATTTMPNINVPKDLSCFMRLHIVTLQRPGEITRMDASRFDLERGRWTVRPGERNAPMHIIPLSPHAASLVQRPIAIRGNAESGAIFRACRNADGVTSARAVSRRFHRLAAALFRSCFSLMDIRRSGRWFLASPPLELPGYVTDMVFGVRNREPNTLRRIFGLTRSAKRSRPGKPVWATSPVTAG